MPEYENVRVGGSSALETTNMTKQKRKQEDKIYATTNTSKRKRKAEDISNTLVKNRRLSRHIVVPSSLYPSDVINKIRMAYTKLCNHCRRNNQVPVKVVLKIRSKQDAVYNFNITDIKNFFEKSDKVNYLLGHFTDSNKSSSSGLIRPSITTHQADNCASTPTHKASAEISVTTVETCAVPSSVSHSAISGSILALNSVLDPSSVPHRVGSATGSDSSDGNSTLESGSPLRTGNTSSTFLSLSTSLPTDDGQIGCSISPDSALHSVSSSTVTAVSPLSSTSCESNRDQQKATTRGSQQPTIPSTAASAIGTVPVPILTKVSMSNNATTSLVSVASINGGSVFVSPPSATGKKVDLVSSTINKNEAGDDKAGENSSPTKASKFGEVISGAKAVKVCEVSSAVKASIVGEVSPVVKASKVGGVSAPKVSKVSGVSPAAKASKAGHVSSAAKANKVGHTFSTPKESEVGPVPSTGKASKVGGISSSVKATEVGGISSTDFESDTTQTLSSAKTIEGHLVPSTATVTGVTKGRTKVANTVVQSKGGLGQSAMGIADPSVPVIMEKDILLQPAPTEVAVNSCVTKDILIANPSLTKEVKSTVSAFHKDATLITTSSASEVSTIPALSAAKIGTSAPKLVSKLSLTFTLSKISNSSNTSAAVVGNIPATPLAKIKTTILRKGDSDRKLIEEVKAPSFVILNATPTSNKSSSAASSNNTVPRTILSATKVTIEATQFATNEACSATSSGTKYTIKSSGAKVENITLTAANRVGGNISSSEIVRNSKPVSESKIEATTKFSDIMVPSPSKTRNTVTAPDSKASTVTTTSTATIGVCTAPSVTEVGFSRSPSPTQDTVGLTVLPTSVAVDTTQHANNSRSATAPPTTTKCHASGPAQSVPKCAARTAPPTAKVRSSMINTSDHNSVDTRASNVSGHGTLSSDSRCVGQSEKTGRIDTDPSGVSSGSECSRRGREDGRLSSHIVVPSSLFPPDVISKVHMACTRLRYHCRRSNEVPVRAVLKTRKKQDGMNNFTLTDMKDLFERTSKVYYHFGHFPESNKLSDH